MQARFKTRVWHKELKKIFEVEGLYAYNNESTEGGEVFLKGFKNSFYFPEEVELMQSTGLKDKNGKLIYEGDIVKNTENGFIYEIVFELGSFLLASKNEKYIHCLGDYWNDNVYSLSQFYFEEESQENIIDKLEIIGNIYETPELLENNQ